ncbi:MAG: (E)-4-hydroxy-3-methylbut-2-enyl-diphosphate synthase [Bacteroidales bacterium]|nr:(E)-4-hydroxy-3-methylbut-2-enyl-diphosphate synthase [Bacteroidales bacterium]
MKTHTVTVGNLKIGGGHPVSVQTMCNTDTLDIEASVAQCKRVAAAGAQLIRLTTQAPPQVRAFARIKDTLSQQGIHVPLAADVHFSADTAMEVARVADKVRINPGNFSRDPSQATALLGTLIEACNQYHTALRIGVNHGSLPAHILEQYGDTPDGMCRAAMEYLTICRDLRFTNVVVSIKSSNTRVMVQANRLLVERMKEAGMTYPIHLGVTESGSGRQGRLKSAAGIITLLKEGIGDTFRVSLTEPPEQEIHFGKLFLPLLSRQHAVAVAVAAADSAPTVAAKASTPAPTTPGATSAASAATAATPSSITAATSAEATEATPAASVCIDTSATPSSDEEVLWNQLIVSACYEWAPGLLDGTIDWKTLPMPFVEASFATKEELIDFCMDLLQATRCVFTKPEYISCPGCGRTKFDLEETVRAVKEATAHLKGCTIAIMGCIVNGPGEMADAQYGYVGEGNGKITLYKGKTPVMRGIPQEEAVQHLLELIESEQQSPGNGAP